MFVIELNRLIRRGYEVSFHPNYTDTYPKQRADLPIRCSIEMHDRYGCNGWGKTLREALAAALEQLQDFAHLEDCCVSD